MDEIDAIIEAEIKNQPVKTEITIDLLKKIIKWDKKNKRLKEFEYKFMAELSEGKKSLTERNKFIASLNLNKVKKFGFEE